MMKKIQCLFAVIVVLVSAISVMQAVSATEEYPTAILNTTNEYDLNFSVTDDVIIDFSTSYDDENEDAKWWRDNYYHTILVKSTSFFDDYNGFITKKDSVYTWGNTYYSEEDVETGWNFVAGIDELAVGQTTYNLGKLPKGKHIVIVCSAFGWQNNAIIAKYNITVSDTRASERDEKTYEFLLAHGGAHSYSGEVRECFVISGSPSYMTEADKTIYVDQGCRVRVKEGTGLSIWQIADGSSVEDTLDENMNVIYVGERINLTDFPGDPLGIGDAEQKEAVLGNGTYLFMAYGSYTQFEKSGYIRVVVGGGDRAVSNEGIKVLLNGNKIDFTDVSPQIINGRTMVPVRPIFEAMGATVKWDPEIKRVTAEKWYEPTKGTIFAIFDIGSNIMMNSFGDPRDYIDTPAMIIDGRTMVPARAAAEAFDYKVSWDEATKTVYIEG